jgi:hypothetical protein
MAKTCPQCQTEAVDDATTCASCGASLSAAPGAGATGATGATAATAAPAAGTPAPAAAPVGAASGGSSLPAYQFDLNRLTLADKIAGIASFVLLISLFLSWFGITVIGISVTASGTAAHGFLWLVFIIVLLIEAYLVCIAGWGNLPFAPQIPHLTAMIVATVVNLVLVFIAFIDKPGGSGVGWEFGAFLALIAAIVAAAPYAIPQVRARTM